MSSADDSVAPGAVGTEPEGVIDVAEAPNDGVGKFAGRSAGAVLAHDANNVKSAHAGATRRRTDALPRMAG